MTPSRRQKRQSEVLAPERREGRGPLKKRLKRGQALTQGNKNKKIGEKEGGSGVLSGLTRRRGMCTPFKDRGGWGERGEKVANKGPSVPNNFPA